MEDLVHDKLPKVLKSMPQICDCERCRMDMSAYALNNLPQKYVVTQLGTVYAKVNVIQMQFDVDVTRAVTDAVMQISQNPRHDS